MDNLVKDGDILAVDTGGKFDCYWGDFDRNFIIGYKEIDEDVQKTHEALWEATERAMEMIKPGVTVGEIRQTMDDSLIKDGYDKDCT